MLCSSSSHYPRSEKKRERGLYKTFIPIGPPVSQKYKNERIRCKLHGQWFYYISEVRQSAMPYYALTTQIPIIKQGVSPIQTFLYAYIFARNQIGTPPIDTSQLRLSSIIDVPHYHQHKSPFCCYLYYQHYYDSCCTNLGIYITIWNSTQQPDVAHQYHPVRNIIKEFLLLFELLPKMRHRYIPIFSRRLLSIICRKTAESRVSYPGWWPLQLIPLHSHYCPL